MISLSFQNKNVPVTAAEITRPATGVTAARGFKASGVHCGLRFKRADLAIIASDVPAATACVFTTNLVKAAPLLVCQDQLSRNGGMSRALVVNAGNANACTGDQGTRDAWRTVHEAASLLGVAFPEVLVSSTGVIGLPLPMHALLSGLPEAVAALSAAGGSAAATAIQTTDTTLKEAVRVVDGPCGRYTVGGAAKGSGMIHPNMATTLGFVTSDAFLPPAVLQTVLRRATARSFNRISVDGDTSTNDMVVVMANGASGVRLREGDRDQLAEFEVALTEVLVDLAKQVAADGEGATRLVTITVRGAASEADALQIGRTIATSQLVKTAIHGADANWGRILAAAGRAGVVFDPASARIVCNGLELLDRNYRSDFDEIEASEHLARDEVEIVFEIASGDAEATVWTCDLSREYVTINASYRS